MSTIVSTPLATPGGVYWLQLTGGASKSWVRAALPDGGGIDADRNPQPLVDIENASVVLNITLLQGLGNTTFTYGSYGGNEQFSTELRPPPRAGTLLVVEGQRFLFSVAREAPFTDDGTITIQAELIGDLCKRAPGEAICKGHNEKATSPPLASGSATGSSETDSAEGSSSQQSVTPPSAPPATVPTPAPTKSASGRRAVLSAVVACLALSAAMA